MSARLRLVALTLAVLAVGTAVGLLAGLRGPALGTAVVGDPGLADDDHVLRMLCHASRVWSGRHTD